MSSKNIINPNNLPPEVRKKILEFKLRPHQGLFFQSDRFRAQAGSQYHHVAMHRQAGKTLGVMRSIQRDCWEIYNEKDIFKIRSDVDSWMPRIAFMAETMRQARSLCWDELQVLLSTFRGINFNNSTLQITIPRPHIGDNLQVFIMALRNHNRVRGLKFRKIYLDESQNLTEESFSKSIHATLASCGGSGTTTGTARPSGFYKEMLIEALKEGTPVHFAKASQTGVFNRKELMQFEKEIGFFSYQQEFECNFHIPTKGAFFSDTLLNLEKQPGFFEAEHHAGAPTLLGVDIGVGKGFACWILQVHGEHLDIIDYFDDYQTGTDLRHDIEAAGYRITDIALPHDSKNKRFEAYKSTTVADEIHKIWPELPRPKPLERPTNKAAQIRSAVENLEAIRMPPRTSIDTDAPRGYGKLKNYSAVVNAEGYITDRIDKSKGNDHAADAIMYAMEYLKMKHGKILRPLRGNFTKPEIRSLSRLSPHANLHAVRRQAMGNYARVA